MSQFGVTGHYHVGVTSVCIPQPSPSSLGGAPDSDSVFPTSVLRTYSRVSQLTAVLLAEAEVAANATAAPVGATSQDLEPLPG